MLAAASASGIDLQDFGVFSVLEFGAVGDAVTNDQPGFQAAADAAIAAGGVLWFPPPPTAYRVADTTNLLPTSGTTFQLDIVGLMKDNGITPTWNTDSKAVFRSRGWKRGSVSGLGMKSALASGSADNTCMFDLDADGTYTSSGQIDFVNCRFNYAGTGTDHIGVRLGHASTSRDISIVRFGNCKWAGATQLGTKGEIGVSLEGQNTLAVTFDNCDFNNLAKGVTNVPTAGAASSLGGGCISVYGGGGEYCGIQFEYQRKGDPLFIGGGSRWENGTTFLKVDNSADPDLAVAVTLDTVNISAFTADIQIDWQSGGSLVLQNVSTDDSGGGRGSAYGAAFVTIDPDSASSLTQLVVRGGCHYGTQPLHTVSSGDVVVDDAFGPVIIDSALKTTGRFT
jgi:hypothetical protein